MVLSSFGHHIVTLCGSY